MARGKQYTNFTLTNKEKIIDVVEEISSNMASYIESTDKSEFTLLYKYINHSDLASFGKATRKDMLEKNILYYLTVEEMKKIEEETESDFQTAHQTCIGLAESFYSDTGLPHPRKVDTYLINNYVPLYLVNDNLEYFSSKYTKQILEKLNKLDGLKWDFDNLDIKLNEKDWITPIEISCAVHGLGTSDNIEFHKLRHHIFKSDTFVILFEKNPDQNKIYILLEKNPAFFSVLGLVNKSYQRYMQTMRKRVVNNVQQKENAVNNVQDMQEDEVTRQQQSKWRTMLAKEMMGYTQVDGQVFCPFTYITADFNELSPLFVASHIKGFADENTTNEEKYDLNNGLLLCANADALFDKHLISVDQDKNLVFSFTLDKDPILKQRLCLMQPVFQAVLNDKRMEYLKYHKEVFDKLEAERKKS